MTKKEIAEKLREALALMNDNGAHWVKGEYQEALEYDDFDYPIEFGYCSLGAIRAVTETSVEDVSEESNALALALAEVLPPIDVPGGIAFDKNPEGRAFDKIVSWNDDDDREWNDVVAKFNEAAALLERD